MTTEGWTALEGKVNNRSFKKDSLRLSWRTQGKGRAKEETLKKVYAMRDIFIKHIPSIKEIKEGKTIVILN